MKPHRKWSYDDGVEWLIEHNNLYAAWEFERDRADVLEAECARLREQVKRLCECESAAVDTCESKIQRLREQRDLFRPYYDAIIDMAVVNWTLDGLSERDAHHAIQRIILQHAQEACDPQVNEVLAKLKERAETAEAENKALLKDIATHADNAKHWIAHANQWERMYSDILEQYERRDAQYLTASSGEQREGTRVYELENQITELRAELARLRSDENDNLTAVYMAGRHDGRKQQEPVADAQTLESLARIGRDVFFAKTPWARTIEPWEHMKEEQKQPYILQTAAILRAAKPYVDMTDDDADDIAEHFGISELMRIANSRIRYAVAIEPTDEEIEELARRLRSEYWNADKWDSDFLAENCRNDWRAVARAAWVHLKGGK